LSQLDSQQLHGISWIQSHGLLQLEALQTPLTIHFFKIYLIEKVL
jgi:hypothetical protein